MFLMSTKWSKDIVNDLDKVNAKELQLNDFVYKHWERFKPVYINFHGYCSDEGELYLLVHDFFRKIVKSDVQPLFQSDNQLFNYFKTAVRNRHYDDTHKKEIQLISLEDLYDINSENNSHDPVEDKIPDTSTLHSEITESELYVDGIIRELSEILSEPYIKLIVLLYRDGLSPKEARKELGVSLTTIRDRIGVIRETLKDYFGIYPRK